jgi:hypothetical protein
LVLWARTGRKRAHTQPNALVRDQPRTLIDAAHPFILARWFYSERFADDFPAILGYRGLRDPAVARRFNYTIFNVQPNLYKEQVEQIRGLGLNNNSLDPDASMSWHVENTTLEALREKLNTRPEIPTLFFLWEPHAILKQYKIGRVNLPAYTDQMQFDLGKSDWKRDIVEKLVSPNLFTLAPDVHQLVSRFSLTNAQQQSMMAEVTANGSSVFTAACNWLRANKKPDSHPTDSNTTDSKQPTVSNVSSVYYWEDNWMTLEFSCDAGQKVVNGTSCDSCAAGYFSSSKGSSSVCEGCLPGRYKECMHACVPLVSLLRDGCMVTYQPTRRRPHVESVGLPQDFSSLTRGKAHVSPQSSSKAATRTRPMRPNANCAKLTRGHTRAPVTERIGASACAPSPSFSNAVTDSHKAGCF